MHTESQWRYRAYRQGLRLVKYKKASPGYDLYGPYALTDLATKRLVRQHLRPTDVEQALYRDIDAESSATKAG